MKRIDKIYEYIKQSCGEYTAEEYKRSKGLSAGEIADALGILRNNVSMELNNLFKMDKVVKINGRPVRYFDKEKLEDLLGRRLKDKCVEVDKVEDLFVNELKKEGSPFERLIGAEYSLKNQIEQAKAAVLYPPNGLHTLILGQTGSGKTLFANMMYSYAKSVGRLKEDAPFIVFNCADYYNTPQLLLSHLFGHIKGAFTGADADKEGIVEKADGGILFLDEIHRLPPEGQEMMFCFMDTGTFSKLGETERKQKANVLIIGATTEDPSSTLLKTFMRRIPIIINIPSLNERSTKERIDIVKHLFSLEAHRVNKPIKITSEALKALIGNTYYGNIGQLKSNIQLICARGFLNSIDEKEMIEIDFKLLPSDIKNGLFSMANKRKEMEEMGEYIEKPLIVMPEGYKMLLEDDTYEPPYNLYKIIEDKANILKQEGMDEKYIKKFITTDINIHIKSFYSKFKGDDFSRDKILKVVDKEILDFSEKIQRIAEKRLNRIYSERFLYALSMHLSAFLNRARGGENLKYTNVEEIIKERTKEYKVALEIKTLIEEKFNMVVPDMEIVYLALLLSSVQDAQNGNVGIIVAAHGSSTASSMLNVAVKLLGENEAVAIDMPLEVSPMKILDKVIEKVIEIDRGKGVLLLVDMGSLSNFETVIKEKTNINIKTIDMVSTPLVLEAVRKASIFDMDLDSIYNSLKNFRGYSQVSKKAKNNTDKVIVTVCSTGKGAAEKLKELVQEIVYNVTDKEIRVVPVGVSNLEQEIKDIKKTYSIIAVVGIVNPNTGIPFISLESLIDGSGEKYLRELIVDGKVENNQNDNKVVLKNLCEESLDKFLTYLNPHKIMGTLFKFLGILESEINTKFENPMSVRIIIHTACALERMVLKEGLKYSYDKTKIKNDVFKAVQKAACVFKDTLNLILTDDELFFIAEILN